ncbi:unnamed protein product [Chrysodeixis includens]|uniref:Uncharacterized protein n=1 Tax=Chrysodeixis includens TaxID=689277 RepID=A0A9N8KV44_CHRIL|nr:unnamed protein product [Chrysodeixis includens]
MKKYLNEFIAKVNAIVELIELWLERYVSETDRNANNTITAKRVMRNIGLISHYEGLEPLRVSRRIPAGDTVSQRVPAPRPALAGTCYVAVTTQLRMLPTIVYGIEIDRI